jgi:hypothetical protein
MDCGAQIFWFCVGLVHRPPPYHADWRPVRVSDQ